MPQAAWEMEAAAVWGEEWVGGRYVGRQSEEWGPDGRLSGEGGNLRWFLGVCWEHLGKR